MKKISAILILSLTLSSFGQSCCQKVKDQEKIIDSLIQLQPKCDKTVKACEDVVASQDKEIQDLKKLVKNLDDQIIEKDRGLKWWHGILIGLAVGFIVKK